MKYPEKIDLHMHTTVSDGTDTPEEILIKVREAGIGVFSVTDHDAVRSSEIIQNLLRKDDPLFIPGSEFSCKDELGKYHILGYGYDSKAQPIRQLVMKSHENRMSKVWDRLDSLETVFGITFPEEEVMKLLARSNPGKPHMGNLMVKHGYAESKEIAIEQFIDKLPVKSRYIRPEEAIRAILDSGGIPVLAHPSYGSGSQRITGKDMEDRLVRLMAFGLQGVEAYYSQFSEELVDELLTLAGKFNLYVTAGSDYHGKNKPNVLGVTRLEAVSDGPEGLRRFLDDALVHTEDR
ncbi:MAG: PHP domain-containing protein [Eubacterium sp.]|nr:PHP domain-containing protein [Eubacterium sp.]